MDNNVPSHVVKMWTPLKRNIDENYNFLPTNIIFKVCSFFIRIFAIIVLSIYNKIVFGLKVKGREKIKDLKGKAYVSICNHVNFLDCTMVACALKEYSLYQPTLKDNFNIPIVGRLVRILGGIPIPQSVKGVNIFNKVVSEILNSNKVVHFFPEGVLIPYDKGIRNFKRGAFKCAYDNNVPIVPMVIKYRKPTGIHRVFKKKPCITIKILDPVFPDKDKSCKEESSFLMENCYEKMKNVIFHDCNA